MALLSSVGHLPEGAGDPRRSLWRTSAHGRGNVTILRPGYLLEKCGPWYRNRPGGGLLPSFMPAKMSMPMISAPGHRSVQRSDDCRAGPSRLVELAGPRGRASPECGLDVGLRLADEPSPYQAAPLERSGADIPPSFGFLTELAGLFAQRCNAFPRTRSGMNASVTRAGNEDSAANIAESGVRREADMRTETMNAKELPGSARLPSYGAETALPTQYGSGRRVESNCLPLVLDYGPECPPTTRGLVWGIRIEGFEP